MKIVQSLWSKPGESPNLNDNNKGGWLEKKYNYFGWALSALQLRRYYENVELVTDRMGYELLINKLELPYSSVVVDLDSLNHYPADLFIMGKVHAYSLQQEPFIHVDSDVFIWDKFDSKLESSPLICQNKEDGNYYAEHYFNLFCSIARNFNFYPPEFDRSILKNGRIKSISAGIIGGQKIDFFKIYKRKVFEFADKNRDAFKSIDVRSSNIVFEQFLFYALAEEMNVSINYYTAETHPFLSESLDFTGVPNKNKFIHLCSGHKKVKLYINCLEYRLQKDYPDYYYKIIKLLKNNQI